MKISMAAAIKLFRTVEPLPEAEIHDRIRVNDVADELCDMGRVCHALP